MELLVATRNAGKLREIRRLLAESAIEVRGLDDFPELPEVVEDGETFLDNARKKAVQIARASGRMTLADDSGLEVTALGGRPGVYSARYAGAGASDADNNARLLNDLAGVPEIERQAAFQCAMVLADPEKVLHEVDGRVDGMILSAPSGEGGFGYDPLFFLPEHDCTMAELSLEIKNRISHRGRALREMLPELLALKG